MNHPQQSLQDNLEASGRDEQITALFTFLVERGAANYDEAVTQLAHALQAATLARESGASAELITAALFHDLGHMLLGEDDGTKQMLAEDLDHECIGADFLKPYFPEAVTSPIRLHVPAKRYLCTVDASYHDQLSAASKRSLAVQGGTLSAAELAAFQQEPFLDQAVDLRRWDDLAKQQEYEVPAIDSFHTIVDRAFSHA